jgi:hypothetical protein
MKWINTISQEYWKYLSVAFLIVVVSQMLTACQKKDNSQAALPPPTNPYGIQPCSGPACAQFPMKLLSMVKTQNVSGTLVAGAAGSFGFEIYGAGMQNPTTDPRKAILYYSGPVSLRGNFTVTAPHFSLCNAPVGVYEFETVTPGTSQLGAISNVRVEAINRSAGNGRMSMLIAQAVVYNSSSGVGVIEGANSNRLGITYLVLESVNGQPCGTIATY